MTVSTNKQTEQGREQRRRILVVEDEAVVALDLERELASLGYEVVGRAASGEAATGLAEQLSPDLVLMDIHLDGEIDGIEAARQLRSRCQIPVVFLTAFGDDETIERAKTGHPLGYVIKPFQGRELRSAIEIALHTHSVEQQLQRSNDALQAVLDTHRHGAIIVDGRALVTYVSNSAESLLGIASASVVGQPWHDVPPLQRAAGELGPALSGNPESNDDRIAVVFDDPPGRASAIEVSVQPDPRDPAGAILLVYDASEVHDLRLLLDQSATFDDIVARSAGMETVFQLIRDVAPVDVTVLIGGETGVGKELIARSIHRNSGRSDGPFVSVNCGGMNEELSLSQLFGHRRGAFTGAVTDHKGVFEQAHGGTLFLDEIGDLPSRVQTMLLRVLEQRTVVPVGSTQERDVDVRVVAATHRPLVDAVDSGEFRNDLLYRLQVARIDVPPLRERREDVPLLARTFLAECRARTGRLVTRVADETMAVLVAYHWPGNVRELKHAIEFSVLRAKSEVIGPEDIPGEITEGGTTRPTDEGPAMIRAALEEAGGNRRRAAEILGISRATLYRRMSQFGVE